ncbi:MAG: agmatine deiminase family protein [Spirochaetes bacterium]|jgi:agmatine deiminase|nr:agmatine deiminase family protein [Spirochaetota bacterium]
MSIRFPAEWEYQSGVMIAWPHEESDWLEYLDEARHCFREIVMTIADFEPVLIITKNKEDTLTYLCDINGKQNIRIVFCETNDTWCRDYGPLSIIHDGKPVLLDFCFNGWGLKFAADRDNMVTSHLYNKETFAPHVVRANMLNFVLEGGSIESDGCETIMTTSDCLMSPNRNGGYSRLEIEQNLCKFFGASRILWLTSGALDGDDTDSHIDTIARFCDKQTIAYVQCNDRTDSHYEQLKEMERQLQLFRTADGTPYRLIPLPMADAVYYQQERLPATYANFLIINGAVLFPEYGTDKDLVAHEALQLAFPDYTIKGINCSVLIRQHGSLHCITMQFPGNILNNRNNQEN